MKTSKLVFENTINMIELSLMVEKLLSFYNYKILSIENIKCIENEIIFNIQVDYSFPPIDVIFNTTTGRIRIQMYNDNISGLNDNVLCSDFLNIYKDERFN